jgi:hypothetical protein
MADLSEQIRAKLDSMVDGSGNLQSCAGCEYDCYCQAYVGYQGALLAVLDLHNPVRQGAGAKAWLECAHCQNADWGGPNVDWPCETVEAIAKELGIEG